MPEPDVKALLAWIKNKHKGQHIRRTGKPYLHHLLFVARKVKDNTALGYETGLCHDLLEETNISAAALQDKLGRFGYSEAQAKHIASCVVELTDVFTKQAYPDLKKKERKAKEAIRLAAISPDAQTVKYADLIYNINWTMKYDRERAHHYLIKKQELIKFMVKGDPALRAEALTLAASFLRKLESQ